MVRMRRKRPPNPYFLMRKSPAVLQRARTFFPRTTCTACTRLLAGSTPNQVPAFPRQCRFQLQLDFTCPRAVDGDDETWNDGRLGPVVA